MPFLFPVAMIDVHGYHLDNSEHGCSFSGNEILCMLVRGDDGRDFPFREDFKFE